MQVAQPAASLASVAADKPRPVCFDMFQQYETNNSKCFDLQMQRHLLLLPDCAAPAGGNNSFRIRKISLLCPAAEQTISLPSCITNIKDLKAGPDGSNHAAVAATAHGLHIVSLSSNGGVAKYEHFNSPVWSCSWSGRNSQQLYVGLANSRCALVDLRRPGQSLLVSPALCRPPLHSVVPMVAGGVDDSPEAVLAASTAGEALGSRPAQAQVQLNNHYSITWVCLRTRDVQSQVQVLLIAIQQW